MRFLVSSDWHIRATNPRYRTDDYFHTLMEKLHWIFELAEDMTCDFILQPGDFFDSPDQSNRVEIDLINLFRDSTVPILTVYGQHDLKYRDPSITVLTKFHNLDLLTIVNDQFDYVYGCSWEQKIPTIQNENSTDILLIHKMIVEDKPLWYGQTDYISAKDFMKKYNFNLVVSGDNHKSFTYETNGRYLVNCGSLMRTNTSQRDHKPVAYIYDTETNELTQHFIPIKPIEEVMNLELADEVKERTEELAAFVDGLSSDYDTELSFEENLKSVMNVNETPNHIKEIANEIVGEYYNL